MLCLFPCVLLQCIDLSGPACIQSIRLKPPFIAKPNNLSCIFDRSEFSISNFLIPIKLSKIKHWIYKNELKGPSFVGLNKSLFKFSYLRSHQGVKMLHNTSLLWFFSARSQSCCVLVFSSHGLPVSDEKFLSSSYSSLIYLPLSSPSSSPTFPSPPDEPGQLKIYLPKKLLECLPKCSSLPKERHRWNTNEVRMRHTQEISMRVSWTQCFLLVTHI